MKQKNTEKCLLTYKKLSVYSLSYLKLIIMKAKELSTLKNVLRYEKFKVKKHAIYMWNACNKKHKIQKYSIASKYTFSFLNLWNIFFLYSPSNRSSYLLDHSVIQYFYSIFFCVKHFCKAIEFAKQHTNLALFNSK